MNTSSQLIEKTSARKGKIRLLMDSRTSDPPKALRAFHARLTEVLAQIDRLPQHEKLATFHVLWDELSETLSEFESVLPSVQPIFPQRKLQLPGRWRN